MIDDPWFKESFDNLVDKVTVIDKKINKILWLCGAGIVGGSGYIIMYGNIPLIRSLLGVG